MHINFLNLLISCIFISFFLSTNFLSLSSSFYIFNYIFIFIVGPHFYFINNDNNDECLLDKQYLLVEE